MSNARFLFLARLCSRHSFFLNRLTTNAAKTLVFFAKPRNKKSCKLVKRSSEKLNMAITKTKNGIFEDVFIILLEDLNNFSIKSRKIIKRSSEIAILVKKYENLDFGGSFDKLILIILIKHKNKRTQAIFSEMEKTTSFLFSKLFF